MSWSTKNYSRRTLNGGIAMTQETNNNVIEENVNDTEVQTENTNRDEQSNDTVEFTPEQQAKIDEIIQKRVATEKKKAEKLAEQRAAEAEKLAKMTKDDKLKYELEQAQKELEDLRKRDTLSQMRKEASTILSDSGITANDALLDFVVTDTAQDTKERVEAFTTVFNSMLKTHVQKQLQQETPKVFKSAGMTREEILSIPDATKRQEAIAQNLHLFN